jgi:hypothetical protein
MSVAVRSVMKGFEEIDFDPEICRDQLDDLDDLLVQNNDLSEQEDILPFFRERMHLSARIGTYHGILSQPNCVAYEFDVLGEFVADLVVGDYRSGAYVLIEFEDAQPDSIFRSGNRHRSHFARRLEKGFSQLVDWMWHLQDLSQTGRFEEIFGRRQPDFKPVLVIGRASYLNDGEREQKRLNWRAQNVSIGQKLVPILTFDRLSAHLRQRLEMYSASG